MNHTNLIENLRSSYTLEILNWDLLSEAADALEAAQAEIDMHMRVAVAAIDNVVQVKAERDQALARLAEIEKQETFNGHQFKEIRRGVWSCSCGKQINEGPSCTHGTPNTLQLQQLTAGAEHILTPDDTSTEQAAQDWHIPVAESRRAAPVASPQPAQVPVNCCPGSPGWPIALRDSTIDAITDGCFQAVGYQGTTVLMRAVARAVERHHGIAAPSTKEGQP